MPAVLASVDSYKAVASEQHLCYTLTQRIKQGPFANSEVTYGGYIGPNAAVVTQKQNDNKYNIVDGSVFFPWDSKRPTDYYSIYGGYYSPLNWPFYRLYSGGGPNRYFRPDPVSDAGGYLGVPGSTYKVTTGNYKGADCIVVRLDSPKRDRPQDNIFYLDPSSYMVIARETIGKPQTKTKRVEPIRRVVEITYGPPAPDTGLPFPTKVKGEYITPDGKRYPAEDITFTEYRRYTPTSDEVDPEKVFRIKMPAIPPRPPLLPEGQYLDSAPPGEMLAERREGVPAWWWYAGAGVLAAVAAGLVVRSRRRRG